jgi:hypothetical protein
MNASVNCIHPAKNPNINTYDNFCLSIEKIIIASGIVRADA